MSDKDAKGHFEIERRDIVTAPGITLSVRIAGSGPLVILMHGFPELGLSWRHQMQPLAEAGFTVAAPDMRGYGRSSKPTSVSDYDVNSLCDDIAAVAKALGAKRWVSVGHDWGAAVAWRCAVRFPDQVAGVFCLSAPYREPKPLADRFADRFFYIRYFQEVGPAEAELEADPRAALKKMFFALSGDAPKDAWIAHRPIDSTLLPGLPDPPSGPLSFMSDAELDEYAEAFRRGGFFGPLSWYRYTDEKNAQSNAYMGKRITQPAGSLVGDKEIVISMSPDAMERQRALCDDLRYEIVLHGGAGHWIQQERPKDVSDALIAFCTGLGDVFKVRTP